LPLISTTRRQFFFSAAALGALALAGDGILFEPNLPRIVRREFPLARLPERMDGFTIALLSDFHYDPYFSVHPIRAAIALVNQLHPDLIVLTGDFVSVPNFGDSEKGALAAEPCAQLLRNLNAPYGLWAVLGNHDTDTDPQYVAQALEAQHINVMINESQAIERDGARFWLSGLNDAFSHDVDVPKTLHIVPSGEAVVMLVHEPDFADVVSRYPVDLQLSGHSHGGQIRIPFLPPFYLPSMARKYYLGTYHIGALTLYTNPGLGTIEVPVRFDCPPEITLVTLRSPKQ
jgi:uncharacterized protein